MLWNGVFYLFTGEICLCLFLLSFSYFPMFIRRPIRSFFSALVIPHGQQIAFSVIAVLIALFAESVRTSHKEKHFHSDDFKEKMMHANRRLRSERNSYIAFGCLFIFMIVAALWQMIKKIIDLEDRLEKKDKVHNALVKQIENSKGQQGLVEVAKALKEMDKSDAQVEIEKRAHEEVVTENKFLQKEVKTLKEEKQDLQRQLQMIESKDEGGGEVVPKKRAAAAKASVKDD